jgi:hypothetical protein
VWSRPPLRRPTAARFCDGASTRSHRRDSASAICSGLRAPRLAHNPLDPGVEVTYNL